jgi:hypothetical protein
MEIQIMQSRSQALVLATEIPIRLLRMCRTNISLSERDDAHLYVVRALACHRTSPALSTLKRAQRTQQHCLVSD